VGGSAPVGYALGMCGRYTLRSPIQRVVQAMNVAEDRVDPAAGERGPRYNVAPTQPVPVVRADEEPAGPRRLDLVRWGLVPSWAKKKAGPTRINARAEGIAKNRVFGSSFKKRRCLVPADGFYEWERVGGRKLPSLFRLPDDGVWAFAGIWSGWKGPDGPLLSCAIVTTAPNALVEPIHDRMPVILDPDAYALWLDPEAPLDALEGLLAPCPDDLLVPVPLKPTVNDVRNQGPECLEEREA